MPQPSAPADHIAGLLRGVERSFTIAFSARSGSTEICNLLERNDVGRPSEFFQTFYNDSEEAGCAPELFAGIVNDKAKAGIYGSKISHAHMAGLNGRLQRDVPNFSSFQDFLPKHKWIWLRRRDKIAQIVSLCRAELSGSWHGAVKEKHLDVEFDFYHHLSRLMILTINENQWLDYFSSNNIAPHIIQYEDFFSDIQQNLSQLIEYITGSKSNDLDISPSLEIQRDKISEQWRSQFLFYLNRIGGFDELLEFGESAVRWQSFFGDFGWRP